MTTFATAFSSTDEEKNSSKIDSNELNQFSNIDLDQQTNSSLKDDQHSKYVSLTDAATYHTEPSSIYINNNSRIPTSSSEEISTNSSTSFQNDRKISLTDLSKMSLSSSSLAVAAVSPTIDKFKQWSRSAYKCTKQSIYEKLGKTTKTIDVELDGQIEELRETKRRYENLLSLARSYANHFNHLLNTQRALCETFLELKQKSFHLSDEFGSNADTQHLLVHHGEILIQALNYFISSLNTLCDKTIEDTINTIRLYETSRLEYDSCRTELEILSPGSHLAEKQKEFQLAKQKYEKLKCDVSIKMKFLDENQTKVMKKQLILFHNAISAYFSGNDEALISTMKQFNLKLISNGDHQQQRKSFIEQTLH